jgi:hypothetical protein
MKLQWWESNLPRISSRPIRDVPLGRPFDITIESDASDSGDTGVGVVTYPMIDAGGAGAEASTLAAAMLALAPAAVTRRMVARHTQRGIEFMAALPQHLMSVSSTVAPCASFMASPLPS